MHFLLKEGVWSYCVLAVGYSSVVGNEMEVCLSPLLTVVLQSEQHKNTNFFHKPVKPAAQTPVSHNAVYIYETF
jgi:hypothetical protein